LDLSYKLFAWAAIGYDFKSDLVFYDVRNSTRKMTLLAYRELILDLLLSPSSIKEKILFLRRMAIPAMDLAIARTFAANRKKQIGLSIIVIVLDLLISQL
jgi:hypothetical protein